MSSLGHWPFKIEERQWWDLICCFERQVKRSPGKNASKQSTKKDSRLRANSLLSDCCPPPYLQVLNSFLVFCLEYIFLMNTVYDIVYNVKHTRVKISGEKASKLRASGWLSAFHFLFAKCLIFAKTMNMFYELCQLVVT